MCTWPTYPASLQTLSLKMAKGIHGSANIKLNKRSYDY